METNQKPETGPYPDPLISLVRSTRMTNYNLRQASKSDKARIFESYRITVGPYVAQAWGWDESFQHKNFWTHHPLEDFKIIELDNSFVGGLHIEEEESDLVIRMIFLLPDFQRLGIGFQLLTDVVTNARARGKGVRLTVIRCNPAKRLYDRLGFVVMREDDSSYDMRLI